MIWFVRHGETDFNKFGITQGQLDTSLNKDGIEQSKEVAKQLKDVSFDIAFCSTLIRADQTLQEILKYHKGLPLSIMSLITTKRNFSFMLYCMKHADSCEICLCCHKMHFYYV